MATRRIPAASPPDTDTEWRTPLEPVEPSSSEESEPEQSAADRVLAMLSDVGDDDKARVKLLRETTDGTYEWCQDYRAPEFEAGGLDMIRKQWGPGTYRVVLYGMVIFTKKDGTPGQRYSWRAKEVVKIARRTDEPLGSPNGGAPSDLSRALDGLMQGQNRLVELLAVQGGAAGLRPDPMAQFKEMLQMASLMKEAFGSREAPKSSIGELLGAIRELREASDEIVSPKKDDGDTLMGMLPKIVDGITTVMAAQRGQPVEMPAVMLPAAVALDAPASAVPSTDTQSSVPAALQPFEGAVPAAPGIPPSAEVVNMGMFVLRGYLASLLELAGRGAPIEEGVTLVVEKCPDEIVDLIELPNWFDLLAQYESRVLPHREWLTKVRNAALGEMNAPEDGAAKS